MSINKVRKMLEEAISNKPSNFYGSFDYTTAGNTRTHPFTIGILVNILWNVYDSCNVEVEPRLVFKTKKGECNLSFNPDIAVYDKNNKPILYIDYESPNSSDSRILTKDIEAFSEWNNSVSSQAEYLVITTLPDRKSDNWKLLYTSSGGYNEWLYGWGKELKQNPKQFWYQIYTEQTNPDDLKGIHFFNISDNTVTKEIIHS